MTSLVLELQADALNKSVQASDLLRKAYVVAQKLNFSAFRQWIEKELNGYASDLPEYRLTTGQIKAWNPYRGWIPIVFEDPKEGEIYSKRGFDQSIAELEHLVSNRKDNSMLHMPFSQEIQRRLAKGAGFQTEVTLLVQHTSIIRIIDAVRNTVLNWSLKLEEEGVLGEGMSFSDVVKSSAARTPQNVNHFYGAMNATQIQQGNENATQVLMQSLDLEAVSKFVEELKSKIGGLDVVDEARAEMSSEIATLEAQIASPKPKVGIVRESMSSVRSILEGASGSAAGAMLLELLKEVAG